MHRASCHARYQWIPGVKIRSRPALLVHPVDKGGDLQPIRIVVRRLVFLNIGAAVRSGVIECDEIEPPVFPTASCKYLKTIPMFGRGIAPGQLVYIFIASRDLM